MRALLPILGITILFSCTSRSVTNSDNKTPSSSIFEKAETLFVSDNKHDSSFFYFVQVTENSKDSLLVAMAYTYMAIIQQSAGDYFGSQESAIQGMKVLNEKDPRHFYCISSLNNELGAASLGLKNYDAAIDYYDLAIKFQADDAYKSVFQNNKAVAYREKGDYLKASQILERLFQDTIENRSEYARIQTNLASLKWRADATFDPIPDLHEALYIRYQEKDEIGITSSYIHLSDYFVSRNSDSTLFYSKKAYTLSRKSGNTDDRIDALKRLIEFSHETEARGYFNEYRHLTDSINDARNSAKNQFALIRYQSEKHKAENLSLQQANSAQELKILRQKIWIVGIGLFVAAMMLLGWLWLRRKRQKLEWKSQVTIHENQLRTSQKVHDIVANGLYRVMSEIEHRQEISKDELLDKIEGLYERSRDISYEPVVLRESNAVTINNLLTSFATQSTIISVVGNEKKFWSRTNPEAIKEVEQVLQELMINMCKHSQAKKVVIRFQDAGECLEIFYMDDGIGLPGKLQFGNGLKSTETRIRKIGGELIFNTGSRGGASIKIQIPVSKR